MKVVTTREIQQHTRLVRQRLESGESLQWTIRGRVVAHLTPAVSQGRDVEWGDPYQRLQALFSGKETHRGASAAALIYQDRG